MSRNTIVLLLASMVALLSTACANSPGRLFPEPGVETNTQQVAVADSSVSFCWLIPGCNESRQEYDDKGLVVATRSQKGFNPFTFIFGNNSGRSVTVARIANARASYIEADAKIKEAIAERIKMATEGEDITSAILAARVAGGNIAASVGVNSRASARVDIRREERTETLRRHRAHYSPATRRALYGK